MNTPLGVIRSAVDTMKTAAHRAAAHAPDVGASDCKFARTVQVIVDASQAPVSACDRLNGLVHRLGVFAAL